jgi:hypothetical protein
MFSASVFKAKQVMTRSNSNHQRFGDVFCFRIQGETGDGSDSNYQHFGGVFCFHIQGKTGDDSE